MQRSRGLNAKGKLPALPKRKQEFFDIAGIPVTKTAGFAAPPVVSERSTQLTALESSNATIYDSMMNNYSSLCASHAGGVARAGWEALYLSEIVMSLLACLTKMYSAYGKYFN